jgi:DNA transformation protein
MSADFVAWCSELLAPAGPVRTRRMFGGHGLYVDELFVALIDAEVLYLKGDDASRPTFEAAGSHIFCYSKGGGETGQINYFSAPAEAMESPALMAPWLRLAMASALRARASKPSATARKTAAAVPPSQPRAPAPRRTQAAGPPAPEAKPTRRRKTTGR